MSGDSGEVRRASPQDGAAAGQARWPWRATPARRAGASEALPRISIVTPSYNQGKYIEQTILSVLGQDYPNLQYIVFDSVSTDETASILERYRDRIDILVIEKDRGQADALNRAFQRADGELLTWLNSDDMLAPGALHQVAAAYRESGADLVAGSLLYTVGPDILYEHITCAPEGPLSLSDLLDVDRHWMKGEYFFQPEVVFSRAAYDRAGGSVDESLHYSMDYDLWVRMAAAGATLKVIGCPVAIFRAHPEQKTTQTSNFEPELRRHAAELRRRFDVPAPADRPVAEDHRLRIALVSDVAQGGAYLAQERLAELIGAAGIPTLLVTAHETWMPERPFADINDLRGKLDTFKADFCLVGNLHAAGNAVSLLEMLAVNYPCGVYLHDMWHLTGRCTYSKGCAKFLQACDERCPTANEYPAERPDRIFGLDRAKLRAQSLPGLSFFANSRWMEDKLLARSGARRPGEPVRSVVLNPPCSIRAGLVLDKAAARRDLGLARDGEVIVCSATNWGDSRKGFAYLVDAIEELGGGEDAPLFLFVGWGDKLVRDRLAHRQDCAFLGHVDQGDALRLYAAADLLLSGAIDEAFGMVYVEAASCGTPSVTFRSGGVADAVEHGVSGLLVDEISGRALAAAARELLRRKRAGDDLGEGARMWAARTHSDIGVVRRFVTDVAALPGVGSKLIPRSQLHRVIDTDAFFFDDSTADDGTVAQIARVVSLPSAIRDAGTAEAAVRLKGFRGGPGYANISLQINEVEGRRLPGPGWREHLFLKIVLSDRLYLDIRPHETEPPLFSRALPEAGAPFMTDDWGPGILLAVGDDGHEARLRELLPGSEIEAIAWALGVVRALLRHRLVWSAFRELARRLDLPMPAEEIRARLEAWRLGEPNRPRDAAKQPPAPAAAIAARPAGPAEPVGMAEPAEPVAAAVAAGVAGPAVAAGVAGRAVSPDSPAGRRRSPLAWLGGRLS